jgi:OOP family OmpA-OmpF porin
LPAARSDCPRPRQTPDLSDNLAGNFPILLSEKIFILNRIGIRTHLMRKAMGKRWLEWGLGLSIVVLLGACAGQDARMRLGIEDWPASQTGVGATQDEAAGAATPQWVETYVPLADRGAALAQLRQRIDRLPRDGPRYFRAKAQCWVDAGQQAFDAHDQWGFVEESIGEAAMLVAGLESGRPIADPDMRLRTVSVVRRDLSQITGVIGSDEGFAQCAGAQERLACAEVTLEQAGHEAWVRNYDAAESAVALTIDRLRASAETLVQCNLHATTTDGPLH